MTIEISKPPMTNRGVTSELCSLLETSVGVDWLTVTSDRDQAGMFWYEKFLSHCKKFGLTSTEWRNKWYSGLDSGDGLQWGYHPQNGYVFIAQGGVAQLYAPSMAINARRVTRMDVQVTILLDGTVWPAYAHETYRKLLVSDFVKERKYSLIENSQGGSTLYVGSRHSDQFGRIYDKGAQSGIDVPGKVWRFEVEFKKPRADSVAERVVRRGPESGVLVTEIKSLVHQWFLMRGITPLFAPGQGAIVVEVARKQTSADKKLWWLRTQVRPTLKKLFQMGYNDEIFEALDISGQFL